MLGRRPVRGHARPRSRRDRLTVAFPADAAFVKKKAEQGRDLVAARGARASPGSRWRSPSS